MTTGGGQENPLEALIDTIAFSSDDWATSRAMSWVYGIVCGWDDEDPDAPDALEAMNEQAARWGWSEAAVERLRRLHTKFEEMR